MRTLSAQALLLDVLDLQERDRIVSFLTSRWGLRRGVAKGAKRRYSRFGGQLQPLAKAHVTWFEREDLDLVRIRDVQLVRPAGRIFEDLEGILVGCYLAEQIQVFALEGVGNEVLFRLLDSTVEALLDGVDRDLATRYLETWVLRLAGIFPPPKECPLCGGELRPGAVLPRGGEGLVCRSCAGEGPGLRVGPAIIAHLLRTGRESLESLREAPPPPRVLRGVEGVCREVRRAFLQDELKSYRVMKDALASSS